MSQYLVLTAMGAEQQGVVSELTSLASECGCNIMDSRMAIFGHEFTFIMLLKGEAKSINMLEVKLPPLAVELDLVTMMKRTSGYKSLSIDHYYEADCSGIDQPGILKAVTAFFANHQLDISSLKSNINPDTDMASVNIEFTTSEKSDIDTLEKEFIELCEQIDVQGCIRQISFA